MGDLHALSPVTLERLRAGPRAGGTHQWLPQVAGGLRLVLTPAKCFEFLRRCCDLHVTHRHVPDREIEAAVALAYEQGNRCSHQHPGAGEQKGVGGQGTHGRRVPVWPEANPEVIRKVLDTTEPRFDGETSTGLRPCNVLPKLFRPGELVCMGADSATARVRPLIRILRDAERVQFICINPMRGLIANNMEGRPSPRCQNNVLVRRYLVAEYDDASLTKRMQAQLATALANLAPLVMAVHSGGKSVHAWYAVEAMSEEEQVRFFAVACLLGADQSRWDKCGWLRMPGGLRVKSDGARVRQQILYFDAETIKRNGIYGNNDRGAATQPA